MNRLKYYDTIKSAMGERTQIKIHTKRMGENIMINVYFDYRAMADNKVKIGVYLEEDEGQEFLDFNIINEEGKEGNPASYNYDYSLMAFKEAVLTVEEYGLDNVCYMNQNKLIFDWVLNDKRDKREEVGDVVDNLNRITLAGVQSEYTVIKSKDNQSKKRLKKLKNKKETKSLEGGTIGIIGQSPQAKVKRPKRKGVPVSELVKRTEQRQQNRESEN